MQTMTVKSMDSVYSCQLYILVLLLNIPLKTHPSPTQHCYPQLGVGDMTKIFYHGICNLISRLRYISRFIIRRVTRFGFLKKRTLQRWRNVSTDIYLLTLKNTKVQKQYC